MCTLLEPMSTRDARAMGALFLPRWRKSRGLRFLLLWALIERLSASLILFARLEEAPDTGTLEFISLSGGV